MTMYSYNAWNRRIARQTARTARTAIITFQGEIKRDKILNLLRKEGWLNVSQIASKLKMSPNSVNYHLKILNQYKGSYKKIKRKRYLGKIMWGYKK